ncbi:Hypothetical protein ABZS17D1_01588 [Kosakonia cowanii]
MSFANILCLKHDKIASFPRYFVIVYEFHFRQHCDFKQNI